MTKPITAKDWLRAELRKSKKQRVKDAKRRKISLNKWTKKLVRRYQSENEGVNPLPFIPKNTFYCYQRGSFLNPKILEDGTPLFNIVPCKFYYTIEIPEEELDDCIGIVAMNQTHIGGCKLLKKTDNDYHGWGLLWDMVKECHLCEEKIV